jgi:DNA-binding beta-propeller fold protein YncE
MICKTAPTVALTVALVWALHIFPAAAQIAVSANDNKSVLVNGVAGVSPNPVPDTVTVIDLGTNPPKLLAEIKAPASIVGPPQSVAVSRDESFALVTGAMKLDPADSKKILPDDKLSVIDLKANPPVVTATLQAGLGAAGVSINRAGTLALVANRSDGTVSVFKVSGKTLTPAGKIQLGDAKSGPSHVVFSPDGKMALVSRDGDNRVSMLTINGDTVEYSKRDIFAGLRPYSLEMSSNGDYAVVGNIGIGQGDADTVSVIDVRAKPPRVVSTTTVGQTPEGISLSPDGKYLAVNVMNGSNKPKDSPFFNDFGLLKIFVLNKGQLSAVTEAKIGHWCQGAAWSRNGKTVISQCAVDKDIRVFGFNGRKLKPGKTIVMQSAPAGLRTAER